MARGAEPEGPEWSDVEQATPAFALVPDANVAASAALASVANRAVTTIVTARTSLRGRRRSDAIGLSLR